MSHKSPRIAELLADLPDDPNPDGLPRHYAGFFHCFNRGFYWRVSDSLNRGMGFFGTGFIRGSTG